MILLSEFQCHVRFEIKATDEHKIYFFQFIGYDKFVMIMLCISQRVCLFVKKKIRNGYFISFHSWERQYEVAKGIRGQGREPNQTVRKK